MAQTRLRARFGTHVQQLRLRADFSQDQLAARARLSRHYISEVESGKRNPSLEVLAQLAKGLSVSLPELMDF